ncbi:MAG: radical SAM protein [Thermoguttaceae bacterium]|nr:radical SAM protein [Thermoguttaceae bacterium]MDW8038080.1 radical SAM protein [Thermoguttaceae bacterium]
MITELSQPLGAFSEWIRTEDVHAAYHLQLLDQAQRVLEGGETVSATKRAQLAERLERWRYQWLSERQGQLRPKDLQLAEALDLAANRLAGRPDRPPRSVRKVLWDPHFHQDLIQQAEAGLDPGFPLDRLVAQAQQMTQQHFGLPGPEESGSGTRRMFLYAPLYLSNYCINYCLYCGFRYPEQIPRRQLSVQEALQEAEVLYRWGFRHLLLVAGDFPSRTHLDYLTDIVRRLHQRGFQLAVEIAPQTTSAYEALRATGVCGVTLYQETYQEDFYYQYHPRGVKSAYDWRLEGLERAAEAGMGRLGLGILLGLAPPEQDLLAMLRHALYLHQRFPDRILAFSLPRIHDAPSSFRIPYPVTDEQLVRFYCVLRIAFPWAELVLSTREPAWLRNRLAKICITQMSAGSSTAPGGYVEKDLFYQQKGALSEACQPTSFCNILPAKAFQSSESPCLLESSEAARATEVANGGLHRRPGEQFPVADNRSPAEVADWLRSEGFQIVWQGEEPAQAAE